jgi:hypothetical protein
MVVKFARQIFVDFSPRSSNFLPPFRQQLGESVQLLQQLGRPAEQLYASYLAHAAARLAGPLAELEEQVAVLTSPGKRSIYWF